MLPVCFPDRYPEAYTGGRGSPSAVGVSKGASGGYTHAPSATGANARVPDTLALAVVAVRLGACHAVALSADARAAGRRTTALEALRQYLLGARGQVPMALLHF